jgi:hypothetical protein
MTHLLFGLLLAGLLQPPPASLAGTWVADLNGTTFMHLELRTENGRLIGALGTGDIQFDKNGVVNVAKSVPATLTPMSSIEISGGVIAFTRVEGDDLEHFRLRITGERAAELTFLPSEEMLEALKEEGIPAPKPIPLRKVR